MSESPLPVEAVLAPATTSERLAVVRSAGLADPGRLGQLIDAAEDLAFRDPLRGRELAQVCVAAAGTSSDAAALVPRARYVHAQASARDGHLDEALELIEAARHGWSEQGEELLALRTGLGRMHIENALGRHDAALATGAELLAELDRTDPSGEVPRDRVELRGIIHQNLAMTHGHAGRWLELLAENRVAAKLYESIGASDRTAALDENGGIALVNLGRVEEALGAFARAVEVRRREGNALAHARCLIEAGRARSLRGEYAAALETFDSAAALFESLGPLPDRDWLAVSRADAYLALNLLDAAVAGYEEAEAAFRAAGLSYDLALTLTSKGAALARANRLEPAGRVLTEASQLWESSGNTPMLAATLLELADLRDRAGSRDAAVGLARRSLEVLEAGRWPVEEFHARLRMADLLLPQLDAAERELDAAARLEQAVMLPQLRYRLEERLGALRISQGRSDEAVELLEDAVTTVERLRGSLPRESMRASFLRDKVDAHARLVELWLDRGGAGSCRRAFEMAERAKSQALVDVMRGSVSARIADGGDDPRVQRMRELLADLDAVYSSLLTADESADPGARHRRRLLLHERAVELEREIALVQLEVPVATPRPALEYRGPILSALRERLPAAVAVLAYHALGDEVIAFVEADGQLSFVRGVTSLSRVELLLDRLAAHWIRFRVGSGLAHRHAPRLVATARKILADLYDELLRPVAHLLDLSPTATPLRLAVVPHGALHQVPFHALHDGVHDLLEVAEVSYAPSATALSMMRPPRPFDGPALVLGVPAPDIPAVRAEVTAVAASLPGAAAHLAEEATTDLLRTAAPTASVVHLACHGLFRPDNPMFSALQLHDRWLTAAEALGLELGGGLVTLSACESGATRVSGGGDEAIGLPRAFLGAGAAAVLVSLWLAEDGPTATLMQDFYSRIRQGQSGASALRAAQLELAANHPHPYHWAPFVYVGCPSTRQEDLP